MNDQATLYARSNAAPFEKLRTWASDHETLTSEDAETYLKAVNYLGLMYTGIRDQSDSSNATARRIMAMSSLLPIGGRSYWNSADREHCRFSCKSWLAES